MLFFICSRWVGRKPDGEEPTCHLTALSHLLSSLTFITPHWPDFLPVFLNTLPLPTLSTLLPELEFFKH